MEKRSRCTCHAIDFIFASADGPIELKRNLQELPLQKVVSNIQTHSALGESPRLGPRYVLLQLLHRVCNSCLRHFALFLLLPTLSNMRLQTNKQQRGNARNHTIPHHTPQQHTKHIHNQRPELTKILFHFKGKCDFHFAAPSPC